MKNFSLFTKVSLFVLFLFGSSDLFAKEVNLYTSRQRFLIQPLLDKFTEETGIKVNVLYVPKGVSEKVAQEGNRTIADLVISTDIGEAVLLKNRGVTAKVNSPKIINRIPVQYRDKERNWFGISLRARVIYASQKRVPKDMIKNYEDLNDNIWKGKICIRSGKHPYNLALISSLIENKGLNYAKKWLLGIKANLARKPQGNDRSQVKGIYSGLCDVALGNSYYYGLMYFNEKDPEQKKWANSVYIIAPNQENRGTHVNLSTMALIKYAKHKEEALQLMEFMTEKKSQDIYAKVNYEFPVIADGEIPELFKKFMGKFKKDDLSMNRIGESRKQASILVDETEFNL